MFVGLLAHLSHHLFPFSSHQLQLSYFICVNHSFVVNTNFIVIFNNI